MTYPHEYAILKESGYSAKELAMNKINRALTEAIVWGVIILVETVWFFSTFQIGSEWFDVSLPAFIVSIAAILFRVLICLFRYKEHPLPWEKSADRNYTPLIEAIICAALVIGSLFWIKSLPSDTGYGDLILATGTLAIDSGLIVRGINCLTEFTRQSK